MPGVFTHGNFDTWSPGYLMFIAAMHNGISRLYETFGNGGADTDERELRPNEYARTWYKQNPPLPKTQVVAAQQQQLRTDRPADVAALLRRQRQAVPAQLLPEEQALDPQAEDRRSGGVRAAGRRSASRRAGRPAARCCRSRASRFRARPRTFTVMMPGKRGPARQNTTTTADARGRVGRAERGRRGRTGRRRSQDRNTPPAPVSKTFPAGSYIVRMDQPYSRIADTLLDYQYWSPNDPQKTPYDDTGWTFPELYNVQAVRVTDVKVLDAPMEKVDRRGRGAGRRDRAPAPSSWSTTTPTSRWSRCAISSRTRRSTPPRSRSKPPARSSTAARSSSRTRRRRDLEKAATDLGLQIVARRRRAVGEDASGADAARRDAAHLAEHADRRLVAAGVRPRAGAVHLHQHAADRERRQPAREVRRHRLSAGRPRPRRRSSTACRCTAIRCRGRRRAETPNLGSEDQTDDMRPGLG